MERENFLRTLLYERIPGTFGVPEEVEPFVKLTKVLEVFTKIEGEYNLNEAQERLVGGQSCLVVLNHPNLVRTYDSAWIVKELEANPETRAIMLARGFREGRKAGKWGQAVPKGIETMGIKTIDIWREKDDFSEEVCKLNNPASLREAIRILRNGGVVAYYPEGKRSKQMIEAKPGLAKLARRAGFVLPITSCKEGLKGAIKVHAPIEVEPLVARLEQIDKQHADQIFEDMVMLTVASALPKQQQGFYREGLELLELLFQHRDAKIEMAEIEKYTTRWFQVANAEFILSTTSNQLG
ncbi:MAG: hypothetical protein ACOX6V_02200 [Patescibacteria group bacterium]|jgi:hypothetical protein